MKNSLVCSDWKLLARTANLAQIFASYRAFIPPFAPAHLLTFPPLPTPDVTPYHGMHQPPSGTGANSRPPTPQKSGREWGQMEGELNFLARGKFNQ